VITGAEWSTQVDAFHAGFYYDRNIGRVAFAAPLVLLLAAVAMATMRMWKTATATGGGDTKRCSVVNPLGEFCDGNHHDSHCPFLPTAQAKKAAKAAKLDALPKCPTCRGKIYGPAIWSKGMELCSNIINGVNKCNQEHLRRLCPPKFAADARYL
jgi:hypothetical protein